jgi:hypothetical protein
VGPANFCANLKSNIAKILTIEVGMLMIVTQLSCILTSLSGHEAKSRLKKELVMQDYLEELLDLLEAEESEELWVSESLGL